MPKRNPKLAHFYHSFTYEQAAEIVAAFDKICVKRNVSDDKTFTTALSDMAQKLRNDTGKQCFDDTSIKNVISDNIQLYKDFTSYVNDTVGVKYNKQKNRVVVSVEYWYFICKESPKQRLFRECGFPNYKIWSKLVDVHKPGQVLLGEVSSSSQIPIVVKDEPFDPEAVDDWDHHLIYDKMSPINPKKLSIL